MSRWPSAAAPLGPLTQARESRTRLSYNFCMDWTRRGFLRLGAGAIATSPLWASRWQTEQREGRPAELDVAYAGSMGAVMEGAVRAALAARGVVFQGRAQGATALARLIAAGTLRPDVFISATAEPLEIVAARGLVASTAPIAHTSMVIAYPSGSRFATLWKRLPWWQVLQQPGIRLGRSDPRTDPQGRNFIFVCRIAERLYRQPGLAQRLLGEVINPAQIFSEASLTARLQTGQLDAAPSYRFQPAPFRLDWVDLPAAINLGSPPAYPVTLSLDGTTYKPQPLDFLAAVMTTAPHPAAAKRFAQWLQGPEAQKILRNAGYGPPRHG